MLREVGFRNVLILFDSYCRTIIVLIVTDFSFTFALKGMYPHSRMAPFPGSGPVA